MLAKPIAKSIASPIAGKDSGNGWTLSPPTIPTISGLTLRSLWQVPYGTPTTLKDAVGSSDLTVNAGGPMALVYDAPSGRPAVYFDGTLELTNASLAQCGICLFFRPDDAAAGTDAAGFGVSNANAFGLVVATDSIYPLRNNSSVGNTAAPINQWMCAFIADDTDGTALFANIGGAVLTPGAAENRTGFSLGGRYPGGSTGTRFKGWILGGCAFDTPNTADFVGLVAKMKALMRHWFAVGAKPSPTIPLLIISGDSIGAGYGLIHAQSPIGKLSTTFNGAVYGSAVNGFATASNIDADVELIDPSFSVSRPKNVCALVGEPSNQIAYGGTGSAAITAVQNWGTARKAVGFQAIICTCLDRSGFDATMNTHKATYNTAMRSAFNVATSSPYVFRPGAGVTYADFMVDIHALNPALFDGVHPNAIGAAAIAEQIQIAIDGWDRTLEPKFSSPSKRFSIDQSITLTCGTTGAAIYYTTDGTTPTAGSTLYSGPIAVTATTTIRAIAIKSGLPDSNVTSETYTKTSTQVVALGWTTGTGTVSGNSISLGGFGENGYAAQVVSAVEDFAIVANVTTSWGGMVLAIDTEVGATTWGSGDLHLTGVTSSSNFPASTYDLGRVYSSGTATDILTEFTAPIKVRLRKVDDDAWIDTSSDGGTTWTNRDKRTGVFAGLTSCRVKVYAISFGTVEAWLEALA